MPWAYYTQRRFASGNSAYIKVRAGAAMAAKARRPVKPVPPLMIAAFGTSIRSYSRSPNQPRRRSMGVWQNSQIVARSGIKFRQFGHFMTKSPRCFGARPRVPSQINTSTIRIRSTIVIGTPPAREDHRSSGHHVDVGSRNAPRNLCRSQRDQMTALIRIAVPTGLLWIKWTKTKS